MNETNFKPGDVVMLKSGGPRMTVESVNGDGTLYCIWHDKNRDYNGTYSAVVLMYPPDNPFPFAVI